VAGRPTLWVGNRRPKLHIAGAADHKFTLIRMVARGRTKRRDEYEPHLASVLRIGAALKDASIHHDHLANLKPSCGDRPVEPEAAGPPSPGGGQLHVGRADDGQLTPSRANMKQQTDGSGRVTLRRHDLAVEGDDACRIELLDPHYVLERKPVVLEREAGAGQRLARADRPRGAKALLAFASKDDLPRVRAITRRRSQRRDDHDSYPPGPLGRQADLDDTAVQHNNLPRLESPSGNRLLKRERGRHREGSREPVWGVTDGPRGLIANASFSRGQLANPNSRATTSCAVASVTVAGSTSAWRSSRLIASRSPARADRRSSLACRRSFSIRGLFAVTESDDKHAPCRVPINAVADDRSFVALQASGSDELQQRRRPSAATDGVFSSSSISQARRRLGGVPALLAEQKNRY
jgi:hypothetical protein